MQEHLPTKERSNSKFVNGTYDRGGSRQNRNEAEAIIKEIEQIAANGPKTEDIEKTREYMLKEWTSSLEKNQSWMNYISIKWNSGMDNIAEQEAAIKAATNADVQAFAKMLLEKKNQIKVMMRPEAQAE